MTTREMYALSSKAIEEHLNQFAMECDCAPRYVDGDGFTYPRIPVITHENRYSETIKKLANTDEAKLVVAQAITAQSLQDVFDYDEEMFHDLLAELHDLFCRYNS